MVDGTMVEKKYESRNSGIKVDRKCSIWSWV